MTERGSAVCLLVVLLLHWVIISGQISYVAFSCVILINMTYTQHGQPSADNLRTAVYMPLHSLSSPQS